MYKLHRKYLINKITVIAFFSIIILSFITYLLIAHAFDDNVSKWLVRSQTVEEIKINYLFFTKLFIIIISIFLGGNQFIKGSDEYCKVLITTNKDKINCCISKILTIFLYEVIITFLVSFIGISIINMSVSFQFNLIYFIVTSLKLILYGLFYTSLSILFVLIIKTLIGMIIPFMIYLVREVIFELNKGLLNQITDIFFPVISVTNAPIFSGFAHLILLIIILNVINLFLYYNKEF